MDTSYKINSHSPHWIKAKKTLSVDMVIMQVVISNAPSFKDKGMASSIRCGMFVDRKLKSLCSVGTMDHEWRLKFGTDPQKYIGRGSAESSKSELFSSSKVEVVVIRCSSDFEMTRTQKIVCRRVLRKDHEVDIF